KSIEAGVSAILEREEQIIVLEDDCIPREDFFDYMEQCLDFYKNDEKVMQVHGYALPDNNKKIDQTAADIYFVTRPGTWGWGTWRRAWKYFDPQMKDVQQLLQNVQEKKKFNQSGNQSAAMLKWQLEGKISSWAIKWF